MIHYKDYDYSVIFDRPDLAFSPYIAALDIQYAHYTPYLWTFTIDSTRVTAYGRTFDELRDFLKILKKKMRLSADHVLVIIVEDLFSFFGSTKKELPYCSEPFVSKSKTDVLLATISECYQLHSYKAYFESELAEDMQKMGIPIPEINSDELSSSCELSQDEIDNSENRVLYMTSIFRQELDLKYQGSPRSLVLTKTARVERLIGAEQRRQSNKANCNIIAQTIKQNPITSNWGRQFLLPMMYKSFFGGVSFFEENTIDKEYDNVHTADITSAYVARMILSRYPIGKFIELEQPKSYKDLFDVPYSRYAMLITFEAHDVELKPGGFPFLPSDMRQSFIDINNKEELADRCELVSSTRMRRAKTFRAVLTDIDFKMFLENYNIKGGLALENILGSKYGYLPDYISNVIVKMYSGKAAAKHQMEKLDAAGLLTPDARAEYENKKSELARLYGIFTKRPIMERYVFDTVTKEPIIAEEHYISENQKYSPVLYQWGVWTTALVRKEIADLRRALMAAPADRQIKVLSGDTDCVNFTGSATDIITHYNEKIKRQIAWRCEQLGVDPEELADLGSLTLKKYKKYKITGLKQYCFIQETENGDKFGYKVGGMSTTCDYFEKNCKTPLSRFRHFGLGLTIPASYAPRKIKTCVVKDYCEQWTDREGNECSARIQSHMETIKKHFTIYPIYDPSPLGNSPRVSEQPMSLEELKGYARRISNPVYNPMELINNKEKGAKK